MKYIITDGKGSYVSNYGFKWQKMNAKPWASRFDSKIEAERMLRHLQTNDASFNNFEVKADRPKVIKHNFA